MSLFAQKHHNCPTCRCTAALEPAPDLAELRDDWDKLMAEARAEAGAADMTEWAAKVLGDVPVAYFNTRQADTPSGNLLPEQWMPAADVITAIAKLAEGDGLVERLLDETWWSYSKLQVEAAAHIAALKAQNRELALDVLASSGQAQEAYAAQLAAEAERDALRAKVARLEGARDAMETCGKCMGSGYGGHPDSGAMCSDCNGSGGVPATDARAEALKEAAAVMLGPLSEMAGKSELSIAVEWKDGPHKAKFTKTLKPEDFRALIGGAE